MRNTDFIKAWVHYMHKAKTPLVPARGNGYEAWIASNQIAAHITNIDFGLKVRDMVSSSFTPSHPHADVRLFFHHEPADARSHGSFQ